MVPEAGIEPARLAAGDFESPASTNFTTRADCEERDYDIFFSGFGGAVLGFSAPNGKVRKVSPDLSGEWTGLSRDVGEEH